MAIRAQNFSNAIVALNPVGYWPLNETTAPPSSKPAAVNSGTLGATDNGTYTDGAFPGVKGALAGDSDTAALFSGASGFNPMIQVPYDANYATGSSFTIEFWVNSPLDPGFIYADTYAPDWACPVNCLDAGSPSAGWLIYEGLNGASGTFDFQTFNQNGATASLDMQMKVPSALLDSNGNMLSNTWYHVAVTFNGAAATGYINGQQVATGTASGYVPSQVSGLTLGNRNDGGYVFQGFMDEVAFYSNVLSGTDILAHYQAGTNPAPATAYHTLVANDHPLLYYRLDDAAAPVANSYGTLGSFLNGYYETGTTPGVAGPGFAGFGANSYACSFSGGKASVTILNEAALLGLGNHDGLASAPVQSVTFAAWVQVPVGSVSSFQTLAGTGDTKYRFDVDTSGLPHFANGGSGDAIGKAVVVNDGNWHFWVGVWDQASSTGYIYIDGQLAGTASETSGGPEGEPFLIGNAPDYNNRGFVGSVAQVALFPTALTAVQIQNLYFSAAVPPIITTQPLPTVAMQGSNVSITVTAYGKAPLTYRWFSGAPGSGTPVSGGNISGATSSALTFTAVQPANDGEYYVVVTNADGLTATSIGVTLSVLTTGLPGSYFAAVMGLSPLGYWPLAETNLPPLSDVATNLGTLGSAGNAAYSASGVTKQWSAGSGPGLTPDGDLAIATDGTAGVVTLPFSSVLSLQAPFSAEAWLFAAGDTGGTTYCPLACVDANSPRSGWLVYWNAVADSYTFRMYNQNGTSTSLNISTSALSVGQWYHVVVVYDGTTGYIYVNGQLAISGTPSGFVPNDASALTIGARSDDAFYFYGGEADVAIYTNALSATNILAHYQTGTNNAASYNAYRDLVLQSHPLLFYRLDEPAYTALPITSDPVAKNYGALGANDNGYYLPGCFPGTVPGPQLPGFPTNIACRFSNPFGGCMQVPQDANNALDLHGPMTVTAWIQANRGDTRFQSFLGRGDSSLRMGVDGGNSGAIHWALPVGEPVGSSVQDGAWHFIAATWDAETMSLYIDGLLNKSEAHSGVWAVVNQPFDIGSVPDYTARVFGGNMSQVAVFATGLSAAQIQALYNAADVPPYIITQPATAVFAINSTGTVSVTASGTSPLAYQWYKGASRLNNSGDISGVNMATLTISPTTLADSGNYQVVITNIYGAVTSTVATITMVSGPIIFPDLPATNYVYVGTTATLTVGLSGTAPFSNAWTFNGHILANGGRVSGAQSTTLTISNAQPSDTGSYQFWSTNSLGTSHSSVGQLVVETALGFNGNGAGWTLNTGSGSGSSPFIAGNNLVQLTTAGAGGQATSFFFDVPLYIGAFKTHFTYWDLNDGADGVCFVVQNSAMGVNAVGDSGGGMGVRGITNSFEVEIDLYNELFAYDTNGLTHEAANGFPVGNPEFSMLGTGDDVGVAGQTKDMTILYDGSVLTMTWSNETSQASATTNFVVGDITQAVGARTAYVGFTGSCGGVNDTQIVGDFSFIPIPPVVSIARDGSGGVFLTWPALSSYALQKNSSVANPAGWTTIAGPHTTVSGQLYDQYQVHVTPATGTEFYRLVVTQ